MTHDELLANINSPQFQGSRTLETPHAALRAVVELHKPIGSHDVCEGCGTKFYPCPTIQAIEKELR